MVVGSVVDGNAQQNQQTIPMEMNAKDGHHILFCQRTDKFFLYTVMQTKPRDYAMGGIHNIMETDVHWKRWVEKAQYTDHKLF